MELTGIAVSHGKFGPGEILGEHEGKITVQFASPYGQKDFVYPDAFERFLIARDASLEGELREALADRRLERERTRRERLERVEQHRLDALAEKSQERSARTRSRRTSTAPKRAPKAKAE
ncbi:hypothetical protein [Beduinella massiliensis]|uniref:hypothetical protein n=1 Tax=Beduinella massiliensis TaxID=1852363 RepID=UPI000C86253B